MPRCFLAKKSASNNGQHWGPEDVTNNNNLHEDEASPAAMLAGSAATVSHRSTIGSISAAKAVLSIQEPICPPPAHQASILASSASAVKAATMVLNLKEPNNNRGTQTLPWPEASKRPQPSTLPPSSTSVTVASGITSTSTATSSRPPRRKRPAQKLPLNLTTSLAASAVTTSLSEPEDYSFVRNSTTTTSKSSVNGKFTPRFNHIRIAIMRLYQVPAERAKWT